MELPQITKTLGYNTSSYSAGAISRDGMVMGGAVPGLAGALRRAQADEWSAEHENNFGKQREQILSHFAGAQAANPVAHQKEKPMSNNRIVKVFIVDPSSAVPADKRVLYQGAEKFTEFTDQELFFEVPINDLLKAHNEYRATVVDKKASEKFGRDIMLEPIRISALAMAVVDVAKF